MKTKISKSEIFKSLNEICNDYAQKITKEDLAYMTERIYIYDMNEQTFKSAIIELLKNYNKYRIVCVASFVTAYAAVNDNQTLKKTW